MSEQIEKGKQTKLLEEVLIIFLLFLCLVCLPFSSWIKDPYWVLFASIMARVTFIVVSLCLLKPFGLSFSFLRETKKESLYCLPFLLLCGGNLLFLTTQGTFSPNTSVSLLLLQGVFALLVALSEEILFRGVIETQLLKKMSPLFGILIASLIFSLTHAVNFFSSSPLQVLLQMGYSFILGLFCGLSYYLSGSLLLPITIHFFFNFFAQYLFEFLNHQEISPLYFILNVLVGGLLVGYGLCLFFVHERKKAKEIVD